MVPVSWRISEYHSICCMIKALVMQQLEEKANIAV